MVMIMMSIMLDADGGWWSMVMVVDDDDGGEWWWWIRIMEIDCGDDDGSGRWRSTVIMVMDYEGLW